MQSHLPKVLTVLQTTRGRGGAAAWGRSVRSCGFACEQFVLLRPVQRQIEFGQPRRSERDGLPALQDRLDQLRAQEGEANETGLDDFDWHGGAITRATPVTPSYRSTQNVRRFLRRCTGRAR